MTVAVDGRSHDLVSIPRSGLEEAWMDVTASAIAIREDLGLAHEDLLARRDPRTHLFRADRGLVSLREYGRRRAGEAAGITYIEPIAPGQLPLPDGCFDPDDRSA